MSVSSSNITGSDLNTTDTTGIRGGTDSTVIGNIADRLKVTSDADITVSASTFATIFRRAEITVATKTETDLSGVTYTVPAGKNFVLTTINANYDTQSPLYIRLKKQTGGAGAFSTEVRLTVKQHGQDASSTSMTFPYGVYLATAGDVIKITYESALAKGSLWAAFTGIEY